MNIVQQEIVDSIDVTITKAGYPVVNVRTIKVTLEDGVAVSSVIHRRFINPIDNVSNEDIEIEKIATRVFTQDAINAYNAEQQRIQSEFE